MQVIKQPKAHADLVNSRFASTKFKQPRTFGDLLTTRHCWGPNWCRFCKDHKECRQYTTRGYICDACIDPRRDEILPSVKRYEAFAAKLEAAANSG